MKDSYQDLMKQIETLKARAEAARATELHQVIQELRENIVAFGITAADLFGKTKSHKKLKPGLQKTRQGVRYRDPESGKEWSGLGKPPYWIKAAENRDAFIIQ